jgi:signal transduction histidine kinase
LVQLSHLGLRKKTFIYVGAGLAALIVLLSLVSLQTINQGIEIASQQRLILAKNVAQNIDVLVLHLHSEMSFISTTLDNSWQVGVTNSDKQELLISARNRLQRHLMAFHQMDVTVSVALLDTQGKVLQTEPFLDQKVGYFLADLPAVKSVLRDQQVYTEVEEAILTGDSPTLSMVAPIKDEQELVRGLIVADIPITIGSFDVVLRRWGAERNLELVNQNGLVLANSIPRTGTKESLHWSLIHLLAKERLPGIKKHPGGNEVAAHIVAFAPLEQVPWGIVLEQPKDELLELTWTMGRLLLIASGAAILIAAALILGFTRQIISPIQRLAAAVEKFGAGDQEVEVPSMGQDEIGRLAQSFESMRSRLKHSIEEINQWNLELEQRVSERTMELERLYQQLRLRDEERSDLLAKIITAQEEERRRVARELHDDISQTLTGLVMSLGSAEAIMESDPNAAKQRLESLRHLTSEAVEDVRRLIRDLRPSLLDDLGLVPAVSWYVENYLAPAGVKATLETSDLDHRLALTLEITLFRVVQEAITNIVKHAQAKTASICLKVTSSTIVGSIEDDGKGFNVNDQHRGKHGGVGILGMKERIELLKGKLRVASEPGKGTRVHFEIPRQESGG